MEEYYCHAQSWGYYTNLQLWSLCQAWRLWKDLEARGKGLSDSRKREQCVVIIDLLGLSLSQLLGQNFSSGKKVPFPRQLMNAFLEKYDQAGLDKESISESFNLLIKDYDACRHFGQPNHSIISQITMESTRQHMKSTLKIWGVICETLNERQEDIEDIVKNILDEVLDYEPSPY